MSPTRKGRPDPAEDRPMTPLEKADSGHEPQVIAPAWDAMSYVIAGPLMLGIPGFLLDRWLGTSWLVAVGILAGMAVSLYLIWFRYGRA